MGKGGALNSWLREFCALVFTQTIQAFIYAIIITLIMATSQFGVEAENNEYRQDQLINTTSMGIINIFALTSIFKIEELARKVFGIQKSGIDTKNPMSSMAKLAFISHFGRRLWDNGKKMVKGGFGVAKAIRTKRKDRRKYYKKDIDMNQKIIRAGANLDNAMSAVGQSEVETSSPDVVPGRNNIGLGNNTSGSSGVDGATLDVASLTVNATNVNMSGRNGNAVESDEEKVQRLKDRLDSLIEARDSAKDAYDDKVSASNKQIQDSLHMAISGITETVGATLGGALGAVIGGADGKDVSHGVMVGMNLGDRVGQGASDLAFSAKDLISDIKKDIKVKGEIGDLQIRSAELSAEVDELIAALKDNSEADKLKIKSVINKIKDDTAKKKNNSRDSDTDSVINNM